MSGTKIGGLTSIVPIVSTGIAPRIDKEDFINKFSEMLFKLNVFYCVIY